MQKNHIILISILIVLIILGIGLLLRVPSTDSNGQNHIIANNETINLPQPKYDSETSVEEALLKRRSVREYKNEALNIEGLSQLLWAAQGVTDSEGHRTAPSAGAIYPLELYVVAGNVKDIPAGLYKYSPTNHELTVIKTGDLREELHKAALNQDPIKNAPAILVLSAIYNKTTQKYGEVGLTFADMEAGHAAQNIYLQAVSLNLGTVTIGGFDDEIVNAVMGLSEYEVPLYLMPVGK